MTITYLDYLKENPIEYERFLTLRRTLGNLKIFLAGRSVLDFGASYGLSACAYVGVGASRVVGVEPAPASCRAWKPNHPGAGFVG